MVGLLEETLAQIIPIDEAWKTKARVRLEQLTMPHWALGRVMDLAESLVGMTRSLTPEVGRKLIVVMAGDHGVTEEGVSLYPAEVTAQMVYNFAAEGAGVNALASVCGAQVMVVDMGVNGDLKNLVDAKKITDCRMKNGTDNIAGGPAMSRDDAVASVEVGIRIVREYDNVADVFCTGDMGIGNTTPSAAIAAAITGHSVADLTGRGTGIGDDQLTHKIRVIEKSLAVNKPDPSDAIGVLAKVGGFEIGGIVGVIIGAASMKKPVVIDGYISTAAALIAYTLSPCSAEYMIAAHQSAEPGHQLMLNFLKKTPLLNLDLRLGEGTGAALALPLLDAAVAVLTKIRTFDEAAVSEADSLGIGT